MEGGGSTIVVTTPSRLHLGLIDLHGGEGRVDGSVGLALSEPCFELRLTRSQTVRIDADPIYHPRIGAVVARARERWGIGPAAVRVIQSIPSHAGLGSGTQLTLGVLAALSELNGVGATHDDIVALSGRGGTSGIGAHAFCAGGFLIDGGHRFPQSKATFLPSAASASAGLGPLLWRQDFPAWDIVIATPHGRHVSGEEEIRLFQTLCPIPEADVGAACRSLVMGMMPALVEQDLASFGAALERFQSVGWKRIEIDAQDELVRDMMGAMRSHGGCGVAMSSWGPTVVAFTTDGLRLADVARRWLSRRNLGGTVVGTRARNTGATIERRD